MSTQAPVLLFGGTFDPVHIGHLRMAVEAREFVAADTVWMVPCHRPSHRQAPGADSDQRLSMLQAALAEQPGFEIDDRELKREGASYTVDTLSEWRRELGPQRALIWCMGSDAFAAIDRWHRWRELLQLAHILVLERPGMSLPGNSVAAQLMAGHRLPVEEVAGKPAGAVLSYQPSQLSISATDVRARVRSGRSLQFLVPDAVAQLIRTHDLYTAS